MTYLPEGETQHQPPQWRATLIFHKLLALMASSSPSPGQTADPKDNILLSPWGEKPGSWVHTGLSQVQGPC